MSGDKKFPIDLIKIDVNKNIINVGFFCMFVMT